MNGRHELKFYINPVDCAELRARLRIVAQLDKNAGEKDSYKIRSLYFDNYLDMAVFEKLSGQSKREKYRLRYYNKDTSFIRLEKKSKANKLTYKESSPITMEQCRELLSGNYRFLKSSDNPLMMEFYIKIHNHCLRPKNIVEYHREAYIYNAGNVRITLDTRIRTSNNVKDFLNPNLTSIPAANAIILEIKYDGFLPDVIRSMVQISSRNQTEFSKYVTARFV